MQHISFCLRWEDVCSESNEPRWVETSALLGSKYFTSVWGKKKIRNIIDIACLTSPKLFRASRVVHDYRAPIFPNHKPFVHNCYSDLICFTKYKQLIDLYKCFDWSCVLNNDLMQNMNSNTKTTKINIRIPLTISISILQPFMYPPWVSQLLDPAHHLNHSLRVGLHRVDPHRAARSSPRTAQHPPQLRAAELGHVLQEAARSQGTAAQASW